MAKGFNPGGHKGKLHRELGIAESEKIPAKRLAKAEHSKNRTIRNDAIRAKTMEGWHHGDGKNTSQHREVTEKPPRRVTNAHGNPGFHPSTKGFHHEGSTHSSKDR